MILRSFALHMRTVAAVFLAPLLAVAFLCSEVSSESAGEIPFQPYVESSREGRIDWDQGVVYGVGRGYPHLNRGSRARALRAAQALALQSILKVAAGIRIDDRETLESLGASGRLEIKLSALVRYEEHETIWEKEGEKPFVRVTYRAPLKGVEGVTRRLVTQLKAAPSPWKLLPQQRSTRSPGSNGAPWLVVDARDLPDGDRVQPALFPQIRKKDGESLYDLGTVSEEALVERGMARYVVLDRAHDELLASGPSFLARLRSLFEAPAAWAQDKKKRKRRGNFVITKATRAEGLKKTNLIISEKDARQIREEDASSGILKECRVIVIVSGTVGGIEGRFRPGPTFLTERSRLPAGEVSNPCLCMDSCRGVSL